MTIPTNPGLWLGASIHHVLNPNSENPRLLLPPHVQRPKKIQTVHPASRSGARPHESGHDYRNQVFSMRALVIQNDSKTL